MVSGSTPTDGELLRRAAAGDGDAFSLLYRRYETILIAFLVRRTRDPELAADLVAETFAAAFIGRRRFRGSSDDEVAGFLFGIGPRQLAQWYRRGIVRRRAMERLGLERPALDDESFARIDELARSAPERAAVAEALRRLSEDHQEALRLRIVEERDYREVAAALGVSEQTARARVSRALRARNRSLMTGEGRV
jgi:RNA polymerase sigma factor (sigma-70 family)